MPGKILIVDPIITNRVMLKAQLVSEYFSVTLAADHTSARREMYKSLPDVLLLNYDCEMATGFATCRAIRGDPRTAYLPIVLLCSTVEDSFWHSAYQFGVDEVLPTAPETDLLSNRLAQLVRRKEVVEEQRVRQRTYIDMGFAENQVQFPPQFPPALTLDCTQAELLLSGEIGAALKRLLKPEFPAVRLRKNVPNPTVSIIEEAQLGQKHALQFLCTLQQQGLKAKVAPKILYVSQSHSPEIYRRALELGADDFMGHPYCAAEMATRVRRLAWLHQIRTDAEKTIDDRLRLAMLDPMTGLYNRRYALQYLENIAKKDMEQARSITVMMLDLDNFKAVNDAFGHPAGDAVICETARRLKNNLRDADLVARVGGEEFLVVLRDTPIAQAHAIAKRMCAHINAVKFQPDTIPLPFAVSISIGVAYSSDTSLTAQDMISHADHALYQSKGQGRNRVTLSSLAA